MKKLLTWFFVAGWSLSVWGALGSLSGGTVSPTKTLRWSLPADTSFEVVASEVAGYSVVRGKGFEEVLAEPGAPALPAKVVLLAIPEGYEVGQVSQEVTWAPLATGVTVYPVQTPVRTTERLVFTEPNAQYYSMDVFPAEAVEQQTIGRASGVRLLPVRVTPVRYFPTAGRVEVATTLSLSVSLTKKSALGARSATSAPRYSRALRQQVADMVANSEDVDVAATTGGLSAKAANGVPDYIVISPPTLVSAWEGYVAARRLAHPELTFTVKSTGDIYNRYTTYPNTSIAYRNHAEQIWGYIKDMAEQGSTYFVLGGPFLQDGVTLYDQSETMLTIENAIPGICANPNGGVTPSDYFYACLDTPDPINHPYPWDYDANGTYLNAGETRATCDIMADVVIVRMTMTTFDYGTGAGVLSASQLISAYTQKLARGERLDFPGRFKYGMAGETSDYVNYASGTNPHTMRTELSFYDEGWNMFDPRHNSVFVDVEVGIRQRPRDVCGFWRPMVEGALMIGGSVWTKGYADVAAARQAFWNADFEFGNIDSHGWALGTGGFNAADVRKNTGLVKVFSACQPCQTGWMDYYQEYDYTYRQSLFKWVTERRKRSVPCLGESYINNPVGGALVSYNNTREGWFSSSMVQDDGMSSAISTLIHASLFGEPDSNTGLAWLRGLQRYSSRIGNGFATRQLDCLIETTHFGDPLVIITPVVDITWTGEAGNKTWSLSQANWRSATNETAAVVYEHADITRFPLTGNETLSVADRVSTRAMAVDLPENATLTLQGAGSLRVMNSLTVTNGNLTLNVPGGVGHDGLTFVGRKGVVSLGSTANAETYLSKITNASELQMRGANAIYDLQTNAVGADTISVTGSSASVSTNNVLRSRTEGTLATFPTIPVTRATLVLQTVNAGGNQVAEAGSVDATPLAAVTNGVLEVATNPMWTWERLTRPVILNNSTLSATGVNVGFGNTASGGFDLISTGTSTISGSSTIALIGETRINVTNASDTLTVSTKFTDGGTQASLAGTIRKQGLGKMILTTDRSAAGRLIVEEGTLELKVLPLVSVTNLIVKAGAKLILPHTTNGRSYQVLIAGGTEIVFETGSAIYDANDLSTPLTGATSKSSMYFIVSGLRTWKGNASGAGTWNTTASNTPWLDEEQVAAPFEAGNAVQFEDLADITNATITVEGSLSASFSDFSNSETAYTFNPKTAGSTTDKLTFVTLATMGPTTFNLPVEVTSDLVASKDILRMLKVDTPLIDIKEGATFGASCITNSRSRGLVKAVRFAPLAIEGTNNEGPALAELRLFRNGAVVPWTGASITSSKPSNSDHGVECLIDNILGDSGNNKWWLNGGGGSSAAELAKTNCYATITFATPIEMFNGYSLQAPDVTAGAEGRGVTAWVLQVSYDGLTFVTIDAQSGFVPSTNYMWYRGSATTPGFTDFINLTIVPEVSVAEGGTLLAQGKHFVNFTLQPNAILKGVPNDELVLSSYAKLTMPTDDAKIKVDVSDLTLTTTPDVILSGANFTAADLYRFTNITTNAELRIVSGNLCAVASSGFRSPYTRVVSGNTTWNTADWMAADVPFTQIWSNYALDQQATVALTTTNSAAVMNVNTPVQMGVFQVTGATPLNVTLQGASTFYAHTYDFRNFGSNATLGFNVGPATVYASTNTTEMAGGSGVLTFQNTGRVVFNAQWTGTVNFGAGDNEIVYRGTQPGTPLNTKNATIETTMALGSDFTWQGKLLTIGPGGNVTAGTFRRNANNRNVMVDGGTLSVSQWITDTDNITPWTTVQNGGQLICAGSFKTSQFTNGGFPTYTVTGTGSLFKVGNLTCNDWYGSNTSVFNVQDGGTLSMGGDATLYSGHFGSYSGYRFNINNGTIAAHGNWTMNGGARLRFEAKIAGGSSFTLDPGTNTITYTQTIAEAPLAGQGGTLLIQSRSATGRVLLTTNNTYTAGTLVTNATLVVQHIDALGTGPLTLLTGSRLELGSLRPTNVLQAGAQGTIVATVASAVRATPLLNVAEDFLTVSAGLSAVATTADGTTLTGGSLKVKDGQLLYVPAGVTDMPYQTTLTSDTTWTATPWVTAQLDDVATSAWNTTVTSAAILTESDATLTVDRAVSVGTLYADGAGTLRLNTNGVDALNVSTYNLSGSSRVELGFPTGAANIIAGGDTVLTGAGTGQITISEGKQLTLSTTWDIAKLLNQGTLAIRGGTLDAPIRLTWNLNLGQCKVLANSVFEHYATEGNKIYKVTGAGANTSTIIMESGQNWGMWTNSIIRDVTVQLSATKEFWIEPEDAFDASVDLVTTTKTVHMGHSDYGWRNYTFGSLAGSAALVNNGVEATITLNMDRAPSVYSGAFAPALIVQGAHPLTLTGESTGALTVAPGATVVLSGWTSGTHLNNGTLSIPVAANATRNFSRVVSGVGRIVASGAGELTVSGANTYTGGTEATAGILIPGSATALGSGPITLSGGTLRLGTLRPANLLATNPSGTLEVTLLSNAATQQLMQVATDFVLPRTGFTVAIKDANGSPVTLGQMRGVRVINGALCYIESALAEQPFFATVTGDASWTALPWEDITHFTVQPTQWDTMVSNVTIEAFNTAPARLTLDRAVTINTLTVRGTGDVELAPDATTGSLQATTINASDATGAVTLSLPLGAANITAGTNTILSSPGTGALTIGAGKQATAPAWGVAPTGAGTFVMHTAEATNVVEALRASSAFTGTTKITQGTWRFGTGTGAAGGNSYYPQQSSIEVNGANAVVELAVGDASGWNAATRKTLTLANGGTFLLKARDSSNMAITLNNGAHVKMASDNTGGSRSWDLLLSGGRGFTVTGSGISTFGGSAATRDAATGDPIIASGKISVRTATSINVAEGAELDIFAVWGAHNGGTDSNLNAITTKTGAGKLAFFRGDSIQRGNLNVTEGTVALVNKGRPNANARTINLSSGAKLELVTSNDYAQVVTHLITGAGRVAKLGAGTTTLNAANTYAGGTEIAAGTLITGTTTALGTGAVKLSGGTLRISILRPTNLLASNPLGTLEVTLLSTATTQQLMQVSTDFILPSTGFTIALTGSTGEHITVNPSEDIQVIDGALCYVKRLAQPPFIATLTDDVPWTWTNLPWEDQTHTTVLPEQWDSAVSAATLSISNTTPARLVMDRDLTIGTLTLDGTGDVELCHTTTLDDVVRGSLQATTIDASTATGSVTLDLPLGAANITAGTNTILTTQGTGCVTIAPGNTVTLRGITWDPTLLTNEGTVNISHWSTNSTVTMTSGADLGVYTIAADTTFKQIATGGNKVYKVTGADVTSSRFIMESDVNWGMNAGSQIRNVTVQLSSEKEFWLESESAFDASVDLELTDKTLHVGHSSNGWRNYTIGSLSGAAAIVNNGVSSVLTLNMVRAPSTYSGSSAAALVVNGWHPLTLSGASTGALTVNYGATAILTETGTTTGTITNDGTLQIDGSATNRVFSHVIAGAGRLKKADAGTLTLSGANTYVGGTDLTGGTLKLAHNTALGQSGTIWVSNATLDFTEIDALVTIAWTTNATVVYNAAHQLPIFSSTSPVTLSVTVTADQIASSRIDLARSVPEGAEASAFAVTLFDETGVIVPNVSIEIVNGTLQATVSSDPLVEPAAAVFFHKDIVSHYDFNTTGSVVPNYIWDSATQQLIADVTAHNFPVNAALGTPSMPKSGFDNAFSGGGTGLGLGTGSNRNGDWMFPTSTNGWTMSLWAMRNNNTTRSLLLLNGPNTGLRTDSGADTEATLRTPQSGNIGYGFFMASGGKVLFRFATTSDAGATFDFHVIGSANTYTWSTAEADWNHILVVSTPGETEDTVTLYVNGAVAGSTTVTRGATFVPVSNKLSTRSEAGDGGQAQQNALDDFCVWNRALSVEEITHVATSDDPIRATVLLETTEVAAVVTATRAWTQLAWQPRPTTWAQDVSTIQATLAATADATLPVNTPVNLNTLALTNAAPLTITVTGTGALQARTIDASGSTARTVLDFATGDAKVLAGSDTVLRISGSGVLSIPTGSKATIETPWGGSIQQSGGTLVYAGTQTYTQGLTIQQGAKVEFAGDLTLGGRLGVDSGTLTISGGIVRPTEFLCNNQPGATTAVINQTGGVVDMTTHGSEPNNGSGVNTPYYNRPGNAVFGHWSGTTTYNLSGGTFNAENRYVELGFTCSSARFNQSGGTFKVKAIVGCTNQGTYNLTGGTLELEERIELQGTGERILIGAGTVKATGAFRFVQNATLSAGATFDLSAITSPITLAGVTLPAEATVTVDLGTRTVNTNDVLITWTGTQPAGTFTLTGTGATGYQAVKTETGLVVQAGPVGPTVDPKAGDTLGDAEKDAVAEAATEAGITSGTIIVSQETATKIMLLDVTPTFTPAGSDTNIVEEIDVAFAVTDITFDPTTGLPTVSATIKDDTGTTPVSTTTAAQVVVYGKATLTDAWEPIGAPDTEPKSTFRTTNGIYKFFKFVVEPKVAEPEQP